MIQEFDSRGEKSVIVNKRKKGQVSGSFKRKKIENSPAHDHEASVITMESHVTDLPVTFAVPLQYIQNI